MINERTSPVDKEVLIHGYISCQRKYFLEGILIHVMTRRPAHDPNDGNRKPKGQGLPRRDEAAGA
jgi:hypothetical protein